MAKFEVAIKNLVCKGCGICVEVCERNCLKIQESFNVSGYYYPEFTNGDACSGCGACSNLCPDYAVTVYKITEEQPA